MIGLALSGGGSRAIAFHLGCLRALEDLGLLERVRVLSTISGGSVVGALYAYSSDKTFAEFDTHVCNLLRRGLHRSIAYEVAKPTNLIRSAISSLAGRVDRSLSRARSEPPTLQAPLSRTDSLHRVLQRDLFLGKTMSSPRRRNVDVIIGSCELRTGTAFRFGSKTSGNWRHGELVDWDVDVGLAVAASTAHPIFLPALDRSWRFTKGGTEAQHRVLLVDGGIYDNLGLQVLEPGRDPSISLHTFQCEYVVVCSAGEGQSPGVDLPTRFKPRVERAFDVVHRRVQDAAMGRLHRLKQAGEIRGFALPYLGQLDGHLPLKPASLVPRADVIGYPTNFAAMSETWLQRLANRGEQLTRSLVEFYLSDIL